MSPLERLKILLQIQSVGREEYRLSIWKALVKMWREEGWKGFMRGNGTNCIRIIPYSAVQFGSYNFYKKVSRRPNTIRFRKRAPMSSVQLHRFPQAKTPQSVCRDFSRRRFVSHGSSCLRRSSWNYLRHFYLST